MMKMKGSAALGAPVLLLLLAVFCSQPNFFVVCPRGNGGAGITGTGMTLTQDTRISSTAKRLQYAQQLDQRLQQQQPNTQVQSTQARSSSIGPNRNNQQQQQQPSEGGNVGRRGASVQPQNNPTQSGTTVRQTQRQQRAQVRIPERARRENTVEPGNQVVREPVVQRPQRKQNEFRISGKKGEQARRQVEGLKKPLNLELPQATYGYELEGYHTDIFQWIEPRVAREDMPYDKWTPQQRAENYLTQQAPTAKYKGIDISELKRKLGKTKINTADFEKDYKISKTSFPCDKWERIYTELNDNAMWEIVSLPFDTLDALFTNLLDTMKKTGQQDRFFRVQINVFTEKIEDWEKLTSLVASSNFALAFAGKDGAVKHSSNHFPSAEDFHGIQSEEKPSDDDFGMFTDTSAPGLYGKPFGQLNTDAYKLRLVAIRKAPRTDNPKMVRIEFRAIPNEEFGRCIISHFMASTVKEGDKVNTFGECMKPRVKCQEGAGSKTPTDGEVKEWSKSFPKDLSNVINQAKYNSAVMNLKDVAAAHPAWAGIATAKKAIESKPTADTLVPYVQCLLVTAAKN